MKALICGSRGWRDKAKIREVIANLATEHALEVVHGAAPKGADRLADQVCLELGVRVDREPADWGRYGKAAGPIRNQLMLDKYQPDLVIAFRSSGKSNGTDDMITKAQDARVRVIIVHEAQGG